jgi:hypothetical protein
MQLLLSSFLHEVENNRVAVRITVKCNVITGYRSPHILYEMILFCVEELPAGYAMDL